MSDDLTSVYCLDTLTGRVYTVDMPTTQTTTKPASAIVVGDTIVTRPDPETLTADVLPTVYRTVERIESSQSKWGSGTLLRFLHQPAGSYGYWRCFDSDELVEVDG